MWVGTQHHHPQLVCVGHRRGGNGRESDRCTWYDATNDRGGLALFFAESRAFQVSRVLDWSCDEQPKSSTHEGGAGSATRCMPKGENSGEGAQWGNFINGKTAATDHVRLADGDGVTVVLQNVNHHGFCASYGGGTGTTVCGTAASPPGANDAIRQR